MPPDPTRVAKQDPRGGLWREDADACCHPRKTEPLNAALEGFDAWIAGRKRYQGATWSRLPMVELTDGRYKVNPLVDWQKDDIEAYFMTHDLPRHLLESRGFPSIGCLPCTDRVAPGEGMRAGAVARKGKDRVRHSSRRGLGLGSAAAWVMAFGEPRCRIDLVSADQ